MASPFPKPERLVFINYDDLTDRLEAHYNPTEIPENFGARYSTDNIPGLPLPLLQYTSGKDRTITMALFFNDYHEYRDLKHSTAEAVEWFRKMTLPSKKKVGKTPSLASAPSKILISLGKNKLPGTVSPNPKFVVQDVGVRRVMFNIEMETIRAQVRVTFKEVLDFPV